MRMGWRAHVPRLYLDLFLAVLRLEAERLRARHALAHDGGPRCAHVVRAAAFGCVSITLYSYMHTSKHACIRTSVKFHVSSYWLE